MAKRRSTFRTVCITLYIICGVSVLLYIAMRLSPAVAEFMNTTVSAASRTVFALVSSIVPFSIAELLAFLALPAAVLVIVWFVRRVKRCGARGARRVIAFLLALISFSVSAFVINGTPGYFGRSVAGKMELYDGDISEDDLVFACESLVYEINDAVRQGEVLVDENGATRNPYSIGETALSIERSYSDFAEVWGFPQRLFSVPKILISSPLVTYLHVSGLYSDVTGEININLNYPDYVIVSTIAHELAHQRGVAPEDEANFMAFAVLRSSNAAYFRYCGCLDALMTCAEPLKKEDPKAYGRIMSTLCDTAKDDVNAFSEFFKKYSDSKAAEVNDKVNDTYLKSQGELGTVSYDEATELIVKYYKTGLSH